VQDFLGPFIPSGAVTPSPSCIGRRFTDRARRRMIIPLMLERARPESCAPPIRDRVTVGSMRATFGSSHSHLQFGA